MATLIEWAGTISLLVGGMILLAGNMSPAWAGFANHWRVNLCGGALLAFAWFCAWMLRG